MILIKKTKYSPLLTSYFLNSHDIPNLVIANLITDISTRNLSKTIFPISHAANIFSIRRKYAANNRYICRKTIRNQWQNTSISLRTGLILPGMML
jgi:hypothetical protein